MQRFNGTNDHIINCHFSIGSWCHFVLHPFEMCSTNVMDEREKEGNYWSTITNYNSIQSFEFWVLSEFEPKLLFNYSLLNKYAVRNDYLFIIIINRKTWNLKWADDFPCTD